MSEEEKLARSLCDTMNAGTKLMVGEVEDAIRRITTRRVTDALATIKNGSDELRWKAIHELCCEECRFPGCGCVSTPSLVDVLFRGFAVAALAPERALEAEERG